MAIDKEKKQLLAQLKALEIFPNNKPVRQLRKQIRQKLQELEGRASLREATKVQAIRQKERVQIKKDAKSRAAKRYHNYIRLIHDNYPKIPYMEIRRQFARRKKREDVSIPDVVWQNPSP